MVQLIQRPPDTVGEGFWGTRRLFRFAALSVEGRDQPRGHD